MLSPAFAADVPGERGLFHCFHAVRLAALVLLLGWQTAYARPDMAPLGSNIADRGSAYYHFTQKQFDSLDGKRHYKVWTGVPNKSAPPGGFPVLYMLDGNAAMDKLSEAFLHKLFAANPPVLVAIGYQTDLPFDLDSRAYDYTPAGTETEQLRGRAGGGSTAFRQLLEARIAPAVEKGIAINPAQRGLWGHSYGGLFVLESWLSSSFFTATFSAVPSLARNDFRLLKAMEALSPQQAAGKHLYLMEGDGDRRTQDENSESGVLPRVRSTLKKLNQHGVSATYRVFPGLTHGAMFTASLQAALRQISQAEK
ncbi:alpha/beta hydrolase [Kosakonia sp. SMBL-WEM22]|nr:alpha/beta hydrolase [Kosakonia sp. SMBL-WEM22]